MAVITDAPILTLFSKGAVAYGWTLIVYDLYEKNPPGYRSTTPDWLNVPLTSTTNSVYVEFGDTAFAVPIHCSGHSSRRGTCEWCCL